MNEDARQPTVADPDNEPRTSGDIVQLPSIQAGLLLLILLIALLGLWVVWSLLSAG